MSENKVIASIQNMRISRREHYTLHDVEEIRGHKVVNGKFYWNVKFQKVRIPEWIPDEDCYCDEEIATYLENYEVPVITIYIICRVSTQRQAEQGHVSLDHQVQMLLRRAERYPVSNFHLKRVKVLTLAQSAYKQTPEAFMSILQHARHGDCVMMYAIDRLSRNVFRDDVIGSLNRAHERGVNIWAEDKGLWYESDPILFTRSIVDSAEFSYKLSLKMKAVYRFKVERGDHVGHLPFGFKRIRDRAGKLVLVEHPEEQEIVRKIKMGWNLRQLNAERYYYRNGVHWNDKLFRKVLAEIRRQR